MGSTAPQSRDMNLIPENIIDAPGLGDKITGMFREIISGKAGIFFTVHTMEISPKISYTCNQ